jgi:hypothetical protein
MRQRHGLTVKRIPSRLGRRANLMLDAVWVARHGSPVRRLQARLAKEERKYRDPALVCPVAGQTGPNAQGETVACHLWCSMKSNSDKLASDQSPATARIIERHYTVAEVATSLRLSRDFVRRTFENEPGVVVFGADKSNRRKRRYRTLRIPEHVLERVLRKRSQV